ncbi:hypothetical protein HYV86_01420 [Candidatus Woesearchaeota archaeon]|nr:hypothetical protein [Candidatus Woesearchaeota archaeon]
MKIFWYALILTLTLYGAIATPTLVNVTALPQGWPCDEFKVMQKTFIANATDIYTGLLCPRDARYDLFECPGDTCSFIGQAYKVQGTLPLFTPYEIGQTYRYHCYACEGTCALTVREGERISLPQFFEGLNVSLLTSQAPFTPDGIWNTKRGDAGHYNVTVQIKDATKIDEATFCVAVNKINIPPHIRINATRIVVNEGDTVTIPVTCTDPNNDPVTITYTGWMFTNERKTTYEDAGKYTVDVTCLDNEGVGQKATVHVEVLDVNRPPEIFQVERRS